MSSFSLLLAETGLHTKCALSDRTRSSHPNKHYIFCDLNMLVLSDLLLCCVLLIPDVLVLVDHAHHFSSTSSLSVHYVLADHKSYLEFILDPKLFSFPALAALSVSEQVIYPASIIGERFPPTARRILRGREGEYRCRSKQISAFLHTYSISLQSEGRRQRGQPTFRRVEATTRGSSILLTYVHAQNRSDTSLPTPLIDRFSLSCCSGNHNSPDVWPQFSFQAGTGSGRGNYFPISFEFCQNRVSGVGGEH